MYRDITKTNKNVFVRHCKDKQKCTETLQRQTFVFVETLQSFCLCTNKNVQRHSNTNTNE